MAMVSLRNRQRLSIGLWVVLFLVAVWWARQRNLTIDARGVAHAATVVLTSAEQGLLRDLEVELHERVEAGQRLAAVDPTDLLRQQQIAAAELEAIRQQDQARVSSDGRVFERDREEASLEHARLEMQVREDEARLESLRQRLALDRALADQGLLPAQKAGDSEREIAIVASRLEATREALEVAARTTGTTSRRQANSPTENPWLTIAAQRRLEWLSERLSRLAIDSPIAGQVTWVYKQAGDSVRPGEPILEVAPVTTQEVHAYVSGATVEGVRPGDRATIDRLTGERLIGRVLSIGGDLRQMPTTLWRNPVAAEWGFLVRLRVEEAVLSPGEYLRLVIARSE